MARVAGRMPEALFFHVNVDQVPDLAQQFKVQSIPCFFLLEGREVVASQVGGWRSDIDFENWMRAGRK